MKPIVGVMPLWDDKKDSMWMLPGYLDGLHQAGGIPIVFPFSEEEQELRQLVGICSGILFTGGHDVSPEVYHEKPVDGLIRSCRKRDIMEMIVIKEVLKTDKPVLGICRGIQFINAALGGSLYQDIPSFHPSEINHRQKAPYDLPAHEVCIAEGSPMHRVLGTGRLKVNSCHHQAIRELAPGLEAMAVSPDGLIEAVFMPARKFLWAVQWHPEFSFKTDPDSRKIFRAFIEAME